MASAPDSEFSKDLIDVNELLKSKSVDAMMAAIKNNPKKVQEQIESAKKLIEQLNDLVASDHSTLIN
jgi:hypothetical protein